MRRALAGLLLALAGCDPTAGLADSADAAAPDEKRYFDGRGTLLREGPWNRVVVDLDRDTLYHVGARRLDDEQPTFYLFGENAREGCAISPNAGTWLVSKPRDAPTRLLPFLESIDERGRGRLRFASLDCEIYDLAVEDASRPRFGVPDGAFLVPTKGGFTLADPWRGEQREIAAEVRATLVWDTAVLLNADGQLKSFSARFEPGEAWGNDPVAAVIVRGGFVVEDADGLHHVKFNRETLTLVHEPLEVDACGLQRTLAAAFDATGSWVAVQQPCGNPKPTLLQLDGENVEVLDSVELPFEADARYVRPAVRTLSIGEPPLFAAWFLTDVDDEGNGTLFVWHDGLEEPLELGPRGSLETTTFDGSATAWDGSAYVNHQQLGSRWVSDWVRFRWDGERKVVAERITRHDITGDSLVNFDGVAGDLARFEGDDFQVEARGVPPSAGLLTSFVGAPHVARVDQYDGVSGRLRLGTDRLAPASFRDLGRQVPPELVRFPWFMPALVFIEGWDEDSGTGTLVAYNYALDARAVIAEGVSSFDLTSYPLDGLLYSVPRGKQRGLWFSKAK